MKIVIVGGGSAGMYIATQLDGGKHDIHLYERSTKLGRKFLVAGDGGLNLTQSEAIDVFVQRYLPQSFLEATLRKHCNGQKRNYLSAMGIPTYIGSSGKVFPERPIKPYQVLDAIKSKMSDNGVEVHYQKLFTRFDKDMNLVFGEEVVDYDVVIFALGGASWSKTGSDGGWAEAFEQIGVRVNEFAASNCTLLVDWTPQAIDTLAGKPLKNIDVYCGSSHSRGEALIVQDGIEGGAIYGVGSVVRQKLSTGEESSIYIDLKPDRSEEEIAHMLTDRRRSVTDVLQKHIKLSSTKIQLLKSATSKEDFFDAHTLASRIKRLPISITGLGDIDQAISTVGGIALDQVDDCYSLKAFPRIYCIGEMLDWDTITGGYLLQACYSMSCRVATDIQKYSNHQN